MISQYQSFETRQGLQRSVAGLEKTKATAMTSIKGAAKWEEQYKSEKAMLDTVTPPDIATDKIKAMEKRLDALKTAWVHGNSTIPSAPTRRQMEQNPVGSDGQFRTHDKAWKDHNLDANGDVVRIDRKTQKGLVWEAKDIKRMLGKDQEYDDPDIANLEKWRPDTAVPLADQRLPQSYALSSKAKENFDAVFPDREQLPVEKKIAAAKVKREVPAERQCQEIKKDGEPCGVWTKKGTDRCGFHTKGATT